MKEYSYTSTLLLGPCGLLQGDNCKTLPELHNLTSTPLLLHNGLYVFIINLFSST